MSAGLQSHGWRPIIVTVAPSFYEEPSDAALRYLLPKNVQIEEVAAWPAQLCRPFGLGDISLRGHWQLRRRLRELVEKIRPDAIFATGISRLYGVDRQLGEAAIQHSPCPRLPGPVGAEA